jgi:hypothetical protein
MGHRAAEDHGAPWRVSHRGVRPVAYYQHANGSFRGVAGHVRIVRGAPFPMVRCVVDSTTDNPRDVLLCRCRQLASLRIIRRSGARCNDRGFRRRGPSETPSSAHRSAV